MEYHCEQLPLYTSYIGVASIASNAMNTFIIGLKLLLNLYCIFYILFSSFPGAYPKVSSYISYNVRIDFYMLQYFI